MDFQRGTFRVRGDVLEIFPADRGETAIRVEFFGDEIDRITEIDFCNPVYFIAKEFYPDSSLSTVCRKDFQNVSPYPEGASLEIHIISCILYINQLPDNIITIPFHARPQRYH